MHRLPRLRKLVALVQEHSTRWSFADDGTAQAPALPLESSAVFFRIDTLTADALRTLCFLDKPPALSCAHAIAALRGRVLEQSHCNARPVAVVMAGAPGSGKSNSLAACLPLIARQFEGPPGGAYAVINPDIWIGELCDNNNAFRNVANCAREQPSARPLHVCVTMPP